MCGKLKHSSRSGRRRGMAFTLIEILIVVVILGILGAIVLPQFSNASHMTRENTLKDDLRYLRMQITVFKAQHRDVPPGYAGGNPSGAVDSGAFVEQLTAYTNEQGQTSAVQTVEYSFGPYLRHMPPNPLNDLTTIRMVGNSEALPAPTGEYGWIYKPQTQEIIPDLTGVDSDGKHYSQY